MEATRMTQAEGARGSGPPRKFTIHSNFGRARQHRSRKNRPCDVCRKRKTACIITTEPPCLFCKSKGLECQSRAEAQSSILISEPVTPSPASASAASSPLSRNLHQRPVSADIARDSLVDPQTSWDGEIVATPNLDAPPLHNPADLVHTLEDNPGTTAHSMSLASEQDPHFIDAFRSVLISERDGIDAGISQVFQGGSDPEEHPVHFLLLHDEFPAHRNAAKHAAAEAIENIVWPHGPALIRLYFRHVHSTLPIISKCRFLRQYATDKDAISASLRGAVYALACVFWNRDPSLPSPCPFLQHELIDYAQESLRRELEAPNLSRLQASILLMHMMPPEIDSVETPYTWVMAAQVTACAQMIGLHQDPAQWNIAPWEKSLRRKLWWASFLTDCWSSVCHGNPPHIGNDTFTTLPPNLDDLRFDEDVPTDLQHMVDPNDMTFQVSDGARFLEMVSVARHLRNVLDCSCSVKATMQSRSQLIPVREQLKEWRCLVPTCLAAGALLQNGPLHLSYYATQVLLFRGLMYPATREAKTTPGSNLRRWLSAALSEFELFVLFIDSITDEELTGFWGRHARSQFILCGNFLIYLFLLATEPQVVETAYRLLQSFQQTIQRLGSNGDLAAKLMLRPTILRIDSFFIQASELIQNGRSVSTTSTAMT